MENKIFYVYIDKTADDNSPFYVGKGLIRRINNIKPRNKKWKNIANKYNYKREIILATKNEDFAFDMEIYFIRMYKTFEAFWKDGSGWGANYTIGGDGASGKIVSDETKLKISGINNKMYGKHHTEETKQKLRELAYTRDIAEQTKQKMSISHTGKKLSDAHKKNISKGNSGKKCTKETKQKMSKSKRGENHPLAKIKEFQAYEIRLKYISGNYTQKQLAIEYNITRSCICSILQNRCWKTADAALLAEIKIQSDKANYANRTSNVFNKY